MAPNHAKTRTGGRPATRGTIAGNFALSVGMPDQPAPEGWRWTRLTDVARLETGHTPSRKRLEYWEGEIPWIGIKDATGNHGRKIYDTIQHTNELGIANSSARILPANTVCLSRTASVGYVVVMGRPMATSQDFVNWVCSDNLDSQFLKYVLLGEQSVFLRFASGTTHQTIYFPEAKAFHVCLPPILTQRAIAHILGTLDDKIELNRRMNETLEAMAQALFKSWFVDFDPVRAKMEGRHTGLPQDIADLFPDRLVDSELGEIPQGWKVIPLDAIARFQNGLALQRFRPAHNEARLPVVKIAQLRAGEANSGEWASATIRPECIIEDGDVLFSWSGSLLVKTWCGGRAALNQHLFKVTSGRHPKWFYLNSLLSHLPAFRRIAQDKATTMGHIRRHHLTDALCVVPPDAVIAGISDTFTCLLKRKVANELVSRTLVTLRDTLLPKLVSGEIRVGDAEMALESVT